MNKATTGLLITLLLMSAACGDDPIGSADRATLAELKAEMAAGTAIALDVRFASDYKLAHIKGAVNIPLNELENRLKELPTNKRIVTYCS